jgi:hypothetical protein
MEKRTPTQELSDVFYALQMSAKNLDYLLSGQNNYSFDFKIKWETAQRNFIKQLQDLKPAIDKVLEQGDEKAKTCPDIMTWLQNNKIKV